MSQVALGGISAVRVSESAGNRVFTVAGVAAVVQLASTLLTIFVCAFLGGEPTTAEEYFAVLGQDRGLGLLRLDLASLVNVCLYTVTSFAVFAALRRRGGEVAALATALVFLGVAVSLANHSAFSMINLSDRYALASTEAERARLLTIGESVIASDWWHSTGGTMAGIFMQGGAVIFSFLMLRGREFGRATAYAGIVANGLDWIHILVGLVLPSAGVVLISIGGLFYLIWFPLLARDLFRLALRPR